MLYGRLEAFEGDGSAWPIYEEQIHVFFRENDTPEEKQWDIFQAICGARVFSLLLDILKPLTTDIFHANGAVSLQQPEPPESSSSLRHED
ncbi:hypothetical protein HPB50_023010 [Hyalomma asiaticum]|uniref:Uncharacterized protein n=1 Tax=Hyalomma asiaticum TaxID=266040 RepID=A0ACB7SBU2_HYAAI|nr:hypothetical protein HPB50_023010 [Hyalomma asiaticum]